MGYKRDSRSTFHLQKTVYLKKSLAAIESDYKMQAESYNVVRLSHKVCKKKISSGKTLYDIEDLVSIFCNIKRPLTYTTFFIL